MARIMTNHVQHEGDNLNKILMLLTQLQRLSGEERDLFRSKKKITRQNMPFFNSFI
ncbi:MAG: hypothetical protein WBA22_08690 [Candidatus Methanofastidiosia archaeon]